MCLQKVLKICYRSLIFMKLGQRIHNILYIDRFYDELVS